LPTDNLLYLKYIFHGFLVLPGKYQGSEKSTVLWGCDLVYLGRRSLTTAPFFMVKECAKQAASRSEDGGSAVNCSWTG
jgi:hypothetical protein